MNHNTKNKLLYLASFLIPAVLLLVGLAWVEAVPFGSNSLILRDAAGQYMDFVSYFRTLLTGENDIFYSFSKNMGGEMVSLLSYYLASPFNLLLAFATDEGLPGIFTLIMVLKLALCGLTFFHASSRLYGCKTVHLAFSTAYALCAYNVIYCWSIMWLDGVLILPLLGLGLYKLWQGKGPWLYSACLAYGLFTNFYIGYMLCIASVLFSLVHMVLLDGGWKQKAAAFGRFLSASCMGGFASAILWLPAFLALLEGRAKFDGNASGRLLNFNILGLAGKFVAGASSPTQLSVGTPHIFCGSLVLLLVVAFFVNGKIALKKRGAALAVLLVFLVSFLLAPINVVWHGFSPNYAFNFRYAFLFCYVFVMLAQYGLMRISDMDRKWLALAGGLVLLLDLGLLAISLVVSIDFLSVAGCLTSALALLAAFGVLAYPGRFRKHIGLLLVLVSVLEMGINCGLSWDAVVDNPEIEMTQMDQYNAYHQRLSPAVDYVKTADTGFYRMEKTFYHDLNEPMFFGYNGLSHFSSSQQKGILRFLEKMGFRNHEDIWAYYGTGSTAEVDALLGVKYVLSEADLAAAKGYELLDTVNDIGIFYNANALPLAFLVQPEVNSLDLSGEDYFALHNALWQAISPAEGEVLVQAQVQNVVLDNVMAIAQESGATRYVRQDESQPASVQYEIPVEWEAPLYYYFTSDEIQEAEIYINGVSDGVYFDVLRWDMSNAGTFPVGQTVTIEIRLLGEQILVQDALFCYEDRAALSGHVQAIRQNPVDLTRQSSAHLTGSFTAAQDQTLLFTIPYDTGWRLWVDGKPVEYTQVLDALLAAEVSAGSHSFALRFVPRGLMPGCVLSVAALAAGCVWFVYDRKKGVPHGKKA